MIWDPKKLIMQVLKFGIVGVIAFCIDYGLFLLLDYALGVDYLIASPVSFTIATIFNYIASMRYVFVGKEGQSKTREFIIFFVLSIVGLGVNQLVLWLCVGVISWPAWIGKLIATVVVMVFNFITRKIFLEDRNAW